MLKSHNKNRATQLELFRNDNLIKLSYWIQKLVILVYSVATSADYFNMVSPVFNCYMRYYATDFVLALGFHN